MQNPDFCTAFIRKFERYQYFDGADGEGSLIQIDSRMSCPFNLVNDVNFSLKALRYKSLMSAFQIKIKLKF